VVVAGKTFYAERSDFPGKLIHGVYATQHSSSSRSALNREGEVDHKRVFEEKPAFSGI
jgi:hypothetical protein